MGLGKTAITLSALEERHLPALVVAPKRVAETVWPAERDKWRPDLGLGLAVGEPAKRAKAIEARQELTVISKDNIDDMLGRKPYRTVVLDELSVYKGRGARFKTARKITDKAEHVWGLTGTPAPNGYLDLWSQMFLLDRGQRLGRSFTNYQNTYFRSYTRLPNGVWINWVALPGSQDIIRGKIEDICLYMNADDELDLPPVTYNSVQVQLPPQAKKHYNTMRKDLVLDLEDLGLDVYSASNAGVLYGKLAQLTSGFIFSDKQDGTWVPIHDAKIGALQEIVDGTGDNLLVFYNFIPERDRLRAAFPQARLLSEDGAIEAWCRGEVPMLLAHPASAAHGLNLQSGGHTIVWISLTWDLELWQQANKRLARQGQNHPVIIHVLKCPGTVDEIMHLRLDGKTFDQSEFLTHLRSPL
jgi:SNF2 family DNA or RNA helicase